MPHAYSCLRQILRIAVRYIAAVIHDSVETNEIQCLQVLAYLCRCVHPMGVEVDPRASDRKRQVEMAARAEVPVASSAHASVVPLISMGSP